MLPPPIIRAILRHRGTEKGGHKQIRLKSRGGEILHPECHPRPPYSDTRNFRSYGTTVLTRALIASLYRIIGLASILPLPNGIFGRPIRACPPEWKWLFATLQRYDVKHKHNQGKRVANGIACAKEGGNATSPLHSKPHKNTRHRPFSRVAGWSMQQVYFLVFFGVFWCFF